MQNSICVGCQNTDIKDQPLFYCGCRYKLVKETGPRPIKRPHRVGKPQRHILRQLRSPADRLTMFTKKTPRMKLGWGGEKNNDLCIFTSILSHICNGPFCKVTHTEVMDDWMAVIRWDEDGGINGIHNITGFEQESIKPEGMLPVDAALKNVTITIEESSKNRTQHKFYLGNSHESPVLEIFPKYIIKQCVQDRTLKSLLACFGIRPEVTKVYSKL